MNILNEYYILERSDYWPDDAGQPNPEYDIVSVTPGSDPLYNKGSWNKYAGPFQSWSEARDNMPEED